MRKLRTLADWIDGGTPRQSERTLHPPEHSPMAGPGNARSHPDAKRLLRPRSERKDVFRCFVLPTICRKTFMFPRSNFVLAIHACASSAALHRYDGKARSLEAAEKEKKPVKVDPDHPQQVIDPSWDKGLDTRRAWESIHPPRRPQRLSPASLRTIFGGNRIFLAEELRCGDADSLPSQRPVERDKTQVGLYFTKKPAEKLM